MGLGEGRNEMEKIYEINEKNPEQCELAKIILANGLKEFTKEHGYEERYGKRVFAKSAKSKSFIKFDHINVVVCIYGFYEYWETRISEHQLKCALTFLNLSKYDKEHDAYFYKLDDIVKFIDRKFELLEKHSDILRKVEKKRAIRIIDTFNSIKL